MTEFRDKIRAAGGKVEFLYDPEAGIATQISGYGFIAMYMVAVSLDGRRLLGTVPATGIGQMAVYPKPSVLTFIQSDELGLWGRNCPFCKKYFRTNHVMSVTYCPYCAESDESLGFISKEQRTYITAFYDAFARAYNGRQNTSLDAAEITDDVVAWHYSEEKLQTHFKCPTKNCHSESDILGKYGYCPGCGRTNSRVLFFDRMKEMLTDWEEADGSIAERKERGETWEKLTVESLSEFEAFAKHLRVKLLVFPMTPNRRKKLTELSFQKPLEADESLVQWFDIGLLKWRGNELSAGRTISETDFPFINKMIQKRHILMHNGGVVDQEYIDRSGDNQVQLAERIHIRSKEAKRFVELVREMGENLLDNVESGFIER